MKLIRFLSGQCTFSEYYMQFQTKTQNIVKLHWGKIVLQKYIQVEMKREHGPIWEYSQFKFLHAYFRFNFCFGKNMKYHLNTFPTKKEKSNRNPNSLQEKKTFLFPLGSRPFL